MNKILGIIFFVPFLFSQIDSTRLVRVLSFNILHGKTTTGSFDLDKIAQVIIDAKPDFVAMQEVDYKTNRAKKYDLATELGWRSKMAPLFARAMSYDGGEYGEAVLTNFTLLSSRNVPLPFSPGNEPRAALEITTIIPSGDTISIIGTHLDHLENETDKVAQAIEINRVFKSNRYPTLLLGDLNAQPGSNTINILEKLWMGSYDIKKPKPTFPSDQPVQKIDYVMYYPANKWKVISDQVICDLVASDHCAYLVVLELQK